MSGNKENVVSPTKLVSSNAKASKDVNNNLKAEKIVLSTDGENLEQKNENPSNQKETTEIIKKETPLKNDQPILEGDKSAQSKNSASKPTETNETKIQIQSKPESPTKESKPKPENPATDKKTNIDDKSAKKENISQEKIPEKENGEIPPKQIQNTKKQEEFQDVQAKKAENPAKNTKESTSKVENSATDKKPTPKDDKAVKNVDISKKATAEIPPKPTEKIKKEEPKNVQPSKTENTSKNNISKANNPPSKPNDPKDKKTTENQSLSNKETTSKVEEIPIKNEQEEKPPEKESDPQKNNDILEAKSIVEDSTSAKKIATPKSTEILPEKKIIQTSEILPKKRDSTDAKVLPRPSSSKIMAKFQVISALQKKTDRSKSPDNVSVLHAFQVSLSKLSQNQTRERGIKELKDLITNNATQPNLRIFFSLLYAAKTDIFSEKEAYLLIISHICSVYRENLIDPIDKAPDLRKTILKVIEYIHSFFPDNRGVIQKICAKALIDVYQFCAKALETDTQLVLIFGPLVRCVSAKTEPNLVACACYCLFEFVKFAATGNDINKAKKKAETLSDLIKTFTFLLDVPENAVLVGGRSQEYIEKLISILSSQNSTQIKIEASICMEKIAKALFNLSEEFQTISNLETIIGSLFQTSKEKDVALRGSSNQALSEWVKVIGFYNKELEKFTQLFKTAKEAQPKGSSAWKDLKNIRNVFKINKITQQEKAQKDQIQAKEIIELPDSKDIKRGVRKPQKELLEPIKNLPSMEINEANTPKGDVNMPNFTGNKLNNQDPKNKNPSKTTPEIDPKERLQKQNSQSNDIPSKPIAPKKLTALLNRQKTSPNENIRYDEINDHIEKYDENYESKFKTADNAIQIKAANYQRKKKGLGGGNIPNNTQMETKLGLLKEMIRKSIERRPQSADPGNHKFIRKNTQPKETIIIENTPAMKTAKSENQEKFRRIENQDKTRRDEIEPVVIKQEKEEEDQLFSRSPECEQEKKLINSIVTINSQQMDTRDQFFQRQTSPPKPPKVSLVRPPQNFDKIKLTPANAIESSENLIFQQISRKLDSELEKPSKKPYIPPLISQLSPINSEIIDITTPKTTNPQKLEPWDEALVYLGSGEYEKAYDEILRFRDDIYLLRLLIKTGPCFDELKEKTSVEIMNRLLDLTNCDFISKTCLGFFQEARKENLLNALSLEDRNYFMKIMEP